MPPLRTPYYLIDEAGLKKSRYFTKDGYPLDKFCRVLKNFSESYGVQVYLEPCEAAVIRSTELVTTVLDVVHNEVDIAIVDASVEAHMVELIRSFGYQDYLSNLS